MSLCAIALCVMAVSGSAKAWTMSPYIDYVYPFEDEAVAMSAAFPDVSGYPVLGEGLFADVCHTSTHALIIQGIWVIDDGKIGFCQYGFRNDGGAEHGTETFTFGFTAKHIVLGGHYYTMTKMKSYYGVRSQNPSSVSKVSLARTWGWFDSFMMPGGGNAISTGVPQKQEEKEVAWLLVNPGMWFL
jgi:hypothetical protein